MYADFDDDPRFDADIEQAEMDAAGDAFHAAQAAGRCCHGSVQAGPRGLACTAHVGGCQAVFGSDDEWAAAIQAAVNGEEA